ncbi:tetrahydrofolylpolyglutamate synthase [Purpureocillium lilacinum]|uniref:Tetrahydrofolylpolyglutamate synthase n=1 Tax=Purpureocillium lilacinum TaxID=33203 RepID=A0A179GTQ7_PURLI|nr:tetrahydrofolylpolyglutamate synthase [Purpureocillium lilacinum]OAQ81327.1 tetrahydrofolylpolyglutamate synthase [Purpureocillium lilacinum]
MSKYQDAVKCLRSRLRPLHSNPAKNVPNNLNMKEWLSELGCEDPDLLNVIHITGTKGKGGTAAYTDSFIRAHCRNASQPIKVGLYTSPHLVTERERIRINSQPISENLFAVTFFRVWDTLCRNYSIERMPGYLQLLALQSVLVFQLEQVDVAIYEVHAGGRKDATNIFDRPVVCGFTTVGLDHADLLGNSIDSIAEHKSGIMKRGRPAYSVFQREQAAKKVLTKEASRLGCPLTDISVNNLMINEEEQNPSLRAFLIDLDLAIRTTRVESSGARGKTGTRAFMAIGALLGEEHSFMHDLESFFWVLFWICIHYDGPAKSRVVTRFEKWNYVDTEELAGMKLGVVAKEAIFLKTTSDNVTEYYAPLIPVLNKLRKVVFPGDKPWDREDERLYSQMTNILQRGQ